MTSRVNGPVSWLAAGYLVSWEVLTSEAQFGWLEVDGHDEMDVQRRADAGAVD